MLVLEQIIFPSKRGNYIDCLKAIEGSATSETELAKGKRGRKTAVEDESPELATASHKPNPPPKSSATHKTAKRGSAKRSAARMDTDDNEAVEPISSATSMDVSSSEKHSNNTMDQGDEEINELEELRKKYKFSDQVINVVTTLFDKMTAGLKDEEVIRFRAQILPK